MGRVLDGACPEADGAVRWTHVWTHMEDAEQTQSWNQGDWIDALSRSTDKPRMEYCEDQNGKDYLHSCSTKPQSWCYNQSKPVLFETDTVELEGTHIPHGQLIQV